jgi:sialate O-acetylesterase
MIGDVWICSGQSNMELPMKRVAPIYEQDIEAATYPDIRYFEVPKTYNFKKPQPDLQSGQWIQTNPKSVVNLSATAYFFAKELYDRYRVPLGLIISAVGGSPVESWISEDSIERYPEYFQELQRFKNDDLIRRIEKDNQKKSEAWYKELYRKDKGHQNRSRPWFSENTNTTDWSVMTVPGYWPKEDGKPVNGVVWFRKEIELPQTFANKPVKLILGRIVDADSVFVNGKFAGTTSYQYPPRRYELPAGTLRKGKNTIVVRVISNSGEGGFVKDKPYQLKLDEQIVDLKGDWKYKTGAKMQALEPETFIRWKPSGLYNAMIAPLLNYSIKGIIWYQGESNSTRPIEYRNLFATLIRDWRSKWNQGDFPFLFVQLPNFMEPKKQPSESNWALLRESQLKTLSLPNTGMAITIDIGEWNDIHPLNKKDVGKRLALTARKVAYGDNNIAHSGPIVESMKMDENKVILTFSQIGSGLAVKGQQLNAFAIAGKNMRFIWAQAKLEDNRVIVWSDELSDPVAVRYAWADNPDNANLYNKEGLPASPFRTDE